MCGKRIHLISFTLVIGLALTSVAEAAGPRPVGWWKLDDGSGTVARDSSGAGNDGTFRGNPRWVTGWMGGALEFDGSDDYVNMDGYEGILQSPWTLACWINTTTGGDMDILSWGTEGGGLKVEFRLHDGRLRIEHGNGNNRGDAQVHDGQWHHGVAQLPEGGVMNDVVFYLDGQPLGTFQIGNGTNPFITTADQDFSIGRSGPRGDRYFDGIIDDVRIFSQVLTQEEIQQVMIGVPPEIATDPSPAHEATDVPREVALSWTPGNFANQHDIYFGTNFDDVNNATNLDSMGPDKIYRARQDVDSYAVGERLDFGQTYYWRIDEVNAPPTSHVVFKGDVWSFTVEPFAYAIENINASASSSAVDKAPENTINGSGLDDSGLLHGKDGDNNMWLSDIAGPQPTWVEFQFDKVYKLHELWVWNSNEFLEPMVGFGFKDVTIEYSVNGADYTTLGTTHEFAQAPGTPEYAHNTTVDFGGVAAKYVRLTANSNWGGILNQYGLSEVRFLHIPVNARNPYPDSEATGVPPDVVLSWAAGREAVRHDVYISTDEQAVIDGTAPVATVTEASHGPLSLDLDVTHYWKVNEVNEAETLTTWESNIWSFTTTEYLVVDDFESYNDLDPDDPESNRIFNAWLDGYEQLTNGSIVGYEVPPFAERAIVHSGTQSMPLVYSNTGGATYSEAERTFAVGQDWTRAGATTLVLYFRGTEGNTGQLYVKVDGSKVVYSGDAADKANVEWTQWNIDLASLGIDLQNVTKLSIGTDGNGASGTLYIDDIRLYGQAPQPEAP
jgi:hypothetical protein